MIKLLNKVEERSQWDEARRLQAEYDRQQESARNREIIADGDDTLSGYV